MHQNLRHLKKYRKRGYKNTDRRGQLVDRTISSALACLRLSHAYSVTFDNGKEFSEHRRITDAGIATYFADPYKSVQRA